MLCFVFFGRQNAATTITTKNEQETSLLLESARVGRCFGTYLTFVASTLVSASCLGRRCEWPGSTQICTFQICTFKQRRTTSEESEGGLATSQTVFSRVGAMSFATDVHIYAAGSILRTMNCEHDLYHHPSNAVALHIERLRGVCTEF